MFHIIKKVYEVMNKQPYGTNLTVDMHDIIVTKEIKDSKPKRFRLDRAFEFFDEHGYIDKPITVKRSEDSKKYILCDEFTRWIVLATYKHQYAPVKVVSK